MIPSFDSLKIGDRFNIGKMEGGKLLIYTKTSDTEATAFHGPTRTFWAEMPVYADKTGWEPVIYQPPAAE